MLDARVMTSWRGRQMANEVGEKEVPSEEPVEVEHEKGRRGNE